MSALAAAGDGLVVVALEGLTGSTLQNCSGSMLQPGWHCADRFGKYLVC
jgi:hypothetical protein